MITINSWTISFKQGDDITCLSCHVPFHVVTPDSKEKKAYYKTIKDLAEIKSEDELNTTLSVKYNYSLIHTTGNFKIENDIKDKKTYNFKPRSEDLDFIKDRYYLDGGTWMTKKLFNFKSAVLSGLMQFSDANNNASFVVNDDLSTSFTFNNINDIKQKLLDAYDISFASQKTLASVKPSDWGHVNLFTEMLDSPEDLKKYI